VYGLHSDKRISRTHQQAKYRQMTVIQTEIDRYL
jgi:hypothetical protein